MCLQSALVLWRLGLSATQIDLVYLYKTLAFTHLYVPQSCYHKSSCLSTSGCTILTSVIPPQLHYSTFQSNIKLLIETSSFTRALPELKLSPSTFFPCSSTGLSMSWKLLLVSLSLFLVHIFFFSTLITHPPLNPKPLVLSFLIKHAPPNIHSQCPCPGSCSPQDSRRSRQPGGSPTWQRCYGDQQVWPSGPGECSQVNQGPQG